MMVPCPSAELVHDLLKTADQPDRILAAVKTAALELRTTPARAGIVASDVGGLHVARLGSAPDGARDPAIDTSQAPRFRGARVAPAGRPGRRARRQRRTASERGCGRDTGARISKALEGQSRATDFVKPQRLLFASSVTRTHAEDCTSTSLRPIDLREKAGPPSWSSSLTSPTASTRWSRLRDALPPLGVPIDWIVVSQERRRDRRCKTPDTVPRNRVPNDVTTPQI
jgi:hypothetical protein